MLLYLDYQYIQNKYLITLLLGHVKNINIIRPSIYTKQIETSHYLDKNK